MEELMEEKRYFSKGERLNDVVVIRSLAIVMVVAFHAYDMLFAEAHFPDVNQMYRGMYYTVNNVILQFRMPLYIFISGYLFSHLENDRGKYATFRGLLANKFKRLIIPFYVFATVFMLSINNFSASPYYTWDYLHLWFITMLFLCFIFTRLLSFLPFSRKPWFKLSVLGLFFVLHCLPPLDFYFFAVPNLLRWYFWFYFGYHLYLNRDRLWGVIDGNKAVVLPSLIVLTTVCLWYKCLTVKEWSVAFTWYGELGNIFICVLVWWLVNKLIFKGFIAGGGLRAFNWLNRYSYGIYIFHYWLQPFMISTTAKSLFHLTPLASSHPVLFPFAFFVSSFLASLALSWLLLKTRAGRFLIG